jgi:hypothetical protein
MWTTMPGPLGLFLRWSFTSFAQADFKLYPHCLYLLIKGFL